MNLYLDVGNSRLKWLLDGQQRMHVATSLEMLAEQWQKIGKAQKPKRIIACTVRGPVVAKQLTALARSVFKIEIEWQISSAEACGVVNAYAFPSQLGVDRWAALIGGRVLFPSSACIIVDAGTAITVDLLNKSGKHLGGVIMPGARLMLKALSAAAQLSPDSERIAEKVQALASSTEEAMKSGVYFSVTGGVKAVIEQQAKLINVKIEDIPIILTGGDIKMLQLTPLQIHTQPRLVLDGLRVMAGCVQ